MLGMAKPPCSPAMYPTKPLVTYVRVDRLRADASDGPKPAPWMFNMLDLNPDYLGWGPEQAGCMRERRDAEGNHTSESSRVFAHWHDFVMDAEFGDVLNNFEPDEYNEIAHFYFEVSRDYDLSEWRCSLTLWILHPRESASMGVRIQEILPEELDAVVSCLGAAAVRNVAKFGPLLRLVALPVSATPSCQTIHVAQRARYRH